MSTITVPLHVGTAEDRAKKRLEAIGAELEDISGQIWSLEDRREELKAESERIEELRFPAEAEEDGTLLIQIRPDGEMTDILEADKSGWDWDRWRRENQRFALLAERVALAKAGLPA